MVIGTSKFDSHLCSINVGIVYLLFKFYHTLTFAPAPEVKVTVLFNGVTLLYVMGQICYPSHEAYSEGSCSWYFYQTARGRT